MKKWILTMCAPLFVFGITAQAEVEVIDAYQAHETHEADQFETETTPVIERGHHKADVPVDEQSLMVNPDNLSLEQRVGRMESELSNLNSVGTLNQLKQLQLELQKLRGELEVMQRAQTIMQLKMGIKPKGSEDAPNSEGGAPKKPISDDEVTSKLKEVEEAEDEYTAYRAAYYLLARKSYGAAIKGFNDVLDRFPKGSLAPNAHYWLGELYSQQGNDKLAVKEFTIVAKRYPKSHKAADALLKIGYTYYNQKSWSGAKTTLRRLLKRYPNSSSAELARARLQRMDELDV